MIKIWELIFLPESWQHLPWFQRQRPYFEVFLGTPWTQRAWTPAIETKSEIRKNFTIRYSNRAATLPLYFDSENDWLFNTGVLERLLCEQPVLFGDRKGVLDSERAMQQVREGIPCSPARHKHMYRETN